MANELRFNLDTSTINYVGKRCKQNDDRTLILTLLSGGVAFPVTGATLSLKAQRSNNTYVIQDTGFTITNNIVTIPMVKDITRVAGKVGLELKITLASKDISTFTFMLEVEPSVLTDGSVASENVISSLEELDGKISLMNLLESELERNIDTAQGANWELTNSIDTAREGNEALNYSIIDAEDKNHALQVVTVQANTVKDALTQDTDEATLVKGYLADEVTNATNASITLNETITDATNANTALQGESDYALSVKGDLETTNTNANDTKLGLQTLMNEVNAINLTPIGAITQFAGDVIPDGWLVCNGQILNTILYQELYTVIGTKYGGSGTAFYLPNLKGKVAVGLDASQTEFNTLGHTGGTKTNTLTESNLPPHTHEATVITHLACDASGSFTITATSTEGNTAIPDANSYLAQPNKVGATSVNTYNNNPVAPKNVQMGGGTVDVTGTVDGDITVTNEMIGFGIEINNLQPYITLNYIIRAK